VAGFLFLEKEFIFMRAPTVKITRDLRLVIKPDAPPLSGSQALDLGKRLIERGAIAIALEAADRPYRPRAASHHAE
jgi:hypothetical protein